MRLETLTLLVAVSVAAVHGAAGSGTEYGRISARQQHRNFNNGARDAANQRRDINRFDGNADSRARWTGQSALRDNALQQNEQAQQRKAQAANQNFGRFSNSFGNIAKAIRDEALRNQYVIKDDAQYKRNNLNSASGSNLANARKTAFDKGATLDDNINYKFSKKYDKASSENGGYEEENGRNLKKLDLIDEREKDRKLIRGDSQVSRSQSDQQKAAKDSAWKSNQAQKQNQAGKYGFADRRVDQDKSRADEKALEFDRKDSRYLEQETGKDQAIRLAKDLAQQQVGYNNEAAATADANRAVADKKYYGGKQLGGANGVTAGQHGGYGPDGAGQAAAAIAGGDKAKSEGSGGAIRSGFDENAAQHERGNELAAAKALSTAEAVNDYARNKDKVAYDQVRGLQDKSTGQFKQGLRDAASQGFSGNNAEAAKAAAEWDQSAAATSSASDLAAKEKNENEALRDRNYYRKIQNDDNEIFTRRKQFYHNKKEGGNNDENLLYNRKKNARNFGAADEADLSKQNQFANLHQDGKVASQQRNFEDLIDRRASLQHEIQNKQAADKGFENRNAQEQAQAAAGANKFNRALSKAAQDDSQSQDWNRRQQQQDAEDAERLDAQDQSQHDKNVAADIEYVKDTNGAPLGDVSARNFVGPELFRPQQAQKGPKDYNLPDVVVNIKPIAPPPKVEQPRQRRPIAPLPDVQQVKTYHPPKYNKAEVNYDTGRAQTNNFQRPTFSRIGTMSLFQGPRQSTFNPKQQATPKSRFTLQRLSSAQQPATASFGKNLFSNNNFGRYARGSIGGITGGGRSAGTKKW